MMMRYLLLFRILIYDIVYLINSYSIAMLLTKNQWT